MSENKQDFSKTIETDKIYYNIDLDDTQIKEMSKHAFKKLVEEKINKKAVEELKKNSTSKTKRLVETMSVDKKGKIIPSKYLKSKELTKKEKETLFKLHTRSYDLKSNFPSKYGNKLHCRICEIEETIEDEEHTFSCPSLLHDIEVDEPLIIDDLYGHLPNQIHLVKNMMKILMRRKIILELRGDQSL